MSWSIHAQTSDPPPGFLPISKTNLLAAAIPEWGELLPSEESFLIGIAPGLDGSAKWMGAIKGTNLDPHQIWELGKPESALIQKHWLKELRNHECWSAICKDIGIDPATWATTSQKGKRDGFSKRTWEGWSQGRPIPYFRAVLMIRAQWNAQTQELHHKRRLNEMRYPKQSRKS